MGLNLNKHGAAMQKAWKAVLDPNDSTDWALFGYEGSSFDLKLVSSGEEGIEEMKDDLNANKIMYAFCKVDDPRTSLAKFVFVHWQGESAPGTRKGLCATHLRDITNYFHGAHVTINARNDDEVDLDEIMEKVAKASSSNYNFREKPMAASMEEIPAPVGSNHQRIIPERELPKLSEREQFWEKEKMEEKARVQAEKIRKISEQQQIDNERRAREEVDSKKREELVTERERKISQIRESEKTTNDPRSEADQWQAQQEMDRQDEQARQNRSNELKKERNDEARRLISQRSSDAKSVFERNSSVGQLNFRRQTSASNVPPMVPEPPISPPKEEPKSLPAPSQSGSDVFVPPPASFGNEDHPGSAKTENEAVQPDITEQNDAAKPDLIQDVPVTPNPPDVAVPSSNGHDIKSPGDLGICAIALYDYEASDETEISFDPNDVITRIEKIDPGWWQGCDSRGQFGLFPANYVEEIDPSEIQNLQG